MVFRIIQEILTNALKHSGASQIVIDCSIKNQYFTLEIRDNGKGFNSEINYLIGKHLGLQNIRTRLELLNATYSVKSSSHKGTQYIIYLPLTTMI
jgi:signal transduction histidine kinase